MVEILGVIPARQGSVRVPRKNLKLLLGKPLIYYTIDVAKEAKCLSRLYVNTDGDEIAAYAKSMCTSVYRRPIELGADVDTSLVLKEMVETLQKNEDYVPDWVVCLQPTSPMRLTEDIDLCVEKAVETNADTVLTVRLCKDHPYWCFDMAKDGVLRNAFNFDMCGSMLVSQNLPPMVYPTGSVYVTRIDWIKAGRMFGQNIHGVITPMDRSVDLETERDFNSAEILMFKKGWPW